MVVRHNRVRNLVAKVCQEGLLSPVLEKQGILGPTSGRRPGDVTLPVWSDGKGLAIDVAVTSPFSAAGLRSSSPADAITELSAPVPSANPQATESEAEPEKKRSRFLDLFRRVRGDDS